MSQQTDSFKEAIRYDAQSDAFAPDIANIKLLVKVAASFDPVQADSTLKYAEKALSLSQKLDYLEGKLDAQYQIGKVYYFRGEIQKMLDVSNRSLHEINQIESGYDKQRAKVYQMLGIAHSSLGSYKPGLEYFIKARDQFEKINEADGAFHNTNNIGVNYLQLHDYGKARDIYLDLDTLSSLGQQKYLVPLNLGRAYKALDEYQKAEIQFNRVLAYADTSGNLNAMSEINLSMADLFKDQQENDKAIELYKKSIQVSDTLQNDIQKVAALNGIAEIYLKEGNPKKALEFANQAFAIADKFNSIPEKNGAAEILYKIYYSQGKAEMALKYHVLHKMFSDSLLNDEVSKEVGRLEAKNAFEKQELALKEQQRKQQLENEKRVAEQHTYMVILISLLLASLAGGYGLHRNAQVRKIANTQLKDKNDEIKSQAGKLKELNEVKNHLFSIISHDLRGPISSLHGIINLHDMNALSAEEIETMMGQVAEKFKYTSSLLTNLLSWSRSQLEGYQTEPENFDLEKLAASVFPVATSKADYKSLTVVNHLDHPLTVHADRSMMELVMLNLLSNAVKFTPAGGRIELSAKRVDAEIQVCVSDSGVGIPEDKLDLLLKDDSFYSTPGTRNEKGTGLGLMLCKDFIQKNKGTLDVQSTPGAGSTFCFSIPTAKAAPQKVLPMAKNLG